MRLTHNLTVQWLALTGFFLFILFVLYQERISLYPYKPVHSAPINWAERQPAGELVQGFTIEQAIEVDGSQLTRREQEMQFCVSLLMANYLNRRNRGHFSVSLSAAGRTQVQTMNARNIRDNHWEIICFDQFRVKDLLQQEARLQLAGIDGVPNRSVTAWLSPAQAGKPAMLNGEASALSLVVEPFLRRPSLPFQRNAHALMLLAAMVMALLVLAVHHRGKP